jgi:predicted metal-binding transcription factor (methanogenesis marker protein 9)
MKKLIVVTLLMSLNLYTMECCKDDKPYKKYRNQILQTLDIDQDDYNVIKDLLIPQKKYRKRQPSCFTGLSRAVSRALALSRNYINS